jgi:hypothetical protein
LDLKRLKFGGFEKGKKVEKIKVKLISFLFWWLKKHHLPLHSLNERVTKANLKTTVFESRKAKILEVGIHFINHS